MTSLNIEDLPAPLAQSRSRIPALPPNTGLLLRSLSDDKLSLSQLAGLLERFPPIAARLIGLANSSWSAPASPITSLEMACSRMGLDVIRSVSIGLAVGTPFKPDRCPGFDSDRFWAASILTADAASWLSANLESWSGMDTHSARTAGLLHNLGLLWLADRMPEQTGQALMTIRQAPEQNLNAALIAQCGIDYPNAGGFLSEHWHLPELLVTAVRQHANPEYHGSHWAAARLIGVAESMASRAWQGQEWDASPVLPITAAEQDAVFARVLAQIDEARAMVHSLFPAGQGR